MVISKWFRFFICLAGVLFSSIAIAEEAPKPRKKLLLLSSIGGGGHLAACRALEQLVGEEYDLKTVYPINELRIWGFPSCEQFYNKMLKRGWIRPMNFLVRHVVPPLMRSRQSKTEEMISSYIEGYQPDLVVSLIPFINYPASEAARKEGLPFLVITTDNDLRHWLMDMHKCKHPSMKITVGSELPHTKDLVLAKGVDLSSIELIGLPLRKEFMEQKDRQQICEEFELPQDRKRVLIMMGGAGGYAAYDYAKKIGKMPLGLHIVVVAGRNLGLKKDLEQLEIDPSNMMSICGFTERVSDLMAISDLIITKPGPGTINEALAMKLPLLIDNIDISLFWERSNVDMVLKHQVGQRVRSFNQLEPYLMTYLLDDQVRQQMDRAFLDVPVNQFHMRIPELIQEMVGSTQDHTLLEEESAKVGKLI